jgi:hypothetical protein
MSSRGNPAKKATRAPQKAHVAKTKTKSGGKASRGKPVPKARQKASFAREGSKTEKILALLTGSGGTTLKELVKTTGWQPHSIRGFLSILRKKKGQAVESTKTAEGERTYSIKV